MAPSHFIIILIFTSYWSVYFEINQNEFYSISNLLSYRSKLCAKAKTIYINSKVKLSVCEWFLWRKINEDGILKKRTQNQTHWSKSFTLLCIITSDPFFKTIFEKLKTHYQLCINNVSYFSWKNLQYRKIEPIYHSITLSYETVHLNQSEKCGFWLINL